MKLVKKFQAGGAVAPEEAAAAQAQQGMGGQDPIMEIAQMFAQGLQAQDCEMLAQGAQMFLQLIQEAQGAPAEAPAEQPVFAKGGKLVGRKQATFQLVRK